jgi:hypothetical protein
MAIQEFSKERANIYCNAIGRVNIPDHLKNFVARVAPTISSMPPLEVPGTDSSRLDALEKNTFIADFGRALSQ